MLASPEITCPSTCLCTILTFQEPCYLIINEHHINVTNAFSIFHVEKTTCTHYTGLQISREAYLRHKYTTEYFASLLRMRRSRWQEMNWDVYRPHVFMAPRIYWFIEPPGVWESCKVFHFEFSQASCCFQLSHLLTGNILGTTPRLPNIHKTCTYTTVNTSVVALETGLGLLVFPSKSHQN